MSGGSLIGVRFCFWRLGGVVVTSAADRLVPLGGCCVVSMADDEDDDDDELGLSSSMQSTDVGAMM